MEKNHKYKLILINPKQAFEGFSNYSITSYPPLALAYIAALTPPSWEVEILDETFEDAFFKPCDLVGITAMTPQAPRAYEIAKVYSEKNVPVIFGGIHPFMVQEESLTYADCIVIGEADNIWPQVIQDFENGNLQQKYKDDKEVDLSRLVKPLHKLFDKRYQWASVLTTRGCPMNCEFCSVTAYNGFKFRRRPIESIIEELKEIKQKFVFFADDNIVGYSSDDAAMFIEFCKSMVKNKLNKYWIAQTSINVVDNEEVLYYAKKSGCLAFFVGIESVDTISLKNMNKNVNIKYIEQGQYIKKIHRHGIGLIGSFIVGCENDKAEIFDKIYDYVIKNHIDIPTISFLVPFPGTPLEKRLTKEKKIKYKIFPHDWSYYNIGNRAMVDTSHLTTKQLNFNMKRVTSKMYSRWNILKRSLYALFYSKSIVIAISAYKGNVSYKNRHFNASYFTDPELSQLEILEEQP
jgi:radical SAM superfamily enzyme YgiQ (UPF0313 family)